MNTMTITLQIENEKVKDQYINEGQCGEYVYNRTVIY